MSHVQNTTTKQSCIDPEGGEVHESRSTVYRSDMWSLDQKGVTTVLLQFSGWNTNNPAPTHMWNVCGSSVICSWIVDWYKHLHYSQDTDACIIHRDQKIALISLSKKGKRPDGVLQLQTHINFKSPSLSCTDPPDRDVRHQRISPILIKGMAHSISLYADNILLYLSDLANSIPNIFNPFEDFGAFLGYRINWSKSTLLPLNSAARNSSLPDTSVTLDRDCFKYLGIIIRPNLPSTVKDNYNSVLDKTDKDLVKRSPYT